MYLLFIFQQLQEKLGLHEHDYRQISPLRDTETASTTMSSTEAHHPRGHNDLGGHDLDSTDPSTDDDSQKSLNSDTIILVCSLVVMILIGNFNNLR